MPTRGIEVAVREVGATDVLLLDSRGVSARFRVGAGDFFTRGKFTGDGVRGVGRWGNGQRRFRRGGTGGAFAWSETDQFGCGRIEVIDFCSLVVSRGRIVKLTFSNIL